MTIELPDEQKVYSTTYKDFKGVDYTSDATSVFRRRSPDAINIMPDDSGNPVKRFGWETVLTERDFADALGVSEGSVEIYRCYYFTLSGVDHIMIFTSAGLFCYKENNLEVLGTDGKIIDSVDRAFFFEGNGEAAFYIYGYFTVWKYTYDNFEELGEEDVYIPTILIGNSAQGGDGTVYEEFNLLGSLVGERFQSNCSEDPQITNMVILSRTVGSTEYQRIKVFTFNSTTGGFDNQLTVIASGEPSQNQCKLVSYGSKSAIQFGARFDSSTTHAPEGEDSILVQYPALNYEYTTYPLYGEITATGTAQVNRR